MVEKTTIEGDCTSAEVFLPESEIEDSCYEQVSSIVDHEAFTAPVKIMPDAHWGSGCVVGFSMPLTDKVIPNVVGVDVGCGITAANVGRIRFDSNEEFDDKVRDRIPMGFDVNNDEVVHLKNEFPWEKANKRFKNFNNKFDEDIEFDGYNIEYFKELCRKVNYDINRAISSVGSLGGGNHFIELSRDKEDNLWIVVHSGSRGLGADTAEYWQERAVKNRKKEARKDLKSFTQFINSEYKDYVNDDLSIKKGKIRKDFDGEEIERAFGKIGNAKSNYQDKIEGELCYPGELAYLEGEEAHGYYIDMIFLQMYASMSRREMVERIVDIIPEADIEEIFESVHNYIDFKDLTIRKGACTAREGEKIIIPFNMKDGAVIARGKGNSEWNKTAPHGAGRNMGRREAHRNLDYNEFKEEMNNIGGKFTEEMLDEAPGAYKETDLIKRQIRPTAEIINELEVIHNIKAE